MGRSEKRKGAAGERELAKALSDVLGVQCHRGRQYHGGPNSPDVVLEIPGINVECKRCETLSLYQAMDQSTKDAGDKVPIVCHRRNRRDWLVVFYLKDLPRLIRLLYSYTEKMEVGD